MEKNEYFKYLLKRYLGGNISQEEKEEFYLLINSNEYDDLLSDNILEGLNDNSSQVLSDLNPQDSRTIFDEILLRSNSNNHIKSIRFKKQIRIVIAVAAILACCFFIWLSNWKKQTDLGHFSKEIVQKQYLKFFNDSDTVQQIVLSDLSTVDVYPNSTIHYPKTFVENERTVFLKGKAFFVISTDSIHPFIVYSESLKTRVLGTSFMINSDSQKGLEEVEVSTGKVQIMEYLSEPKVSEGVIKSVVLMPNQKGVYLQKERNLNKTLVNVPKPLINNEKPSSSRSEDVFNYDQANLSNVFKDLELSYGVNIVLENSIMANCTFTGSLTDSNLFTKLKIICLATQSTYEVVGTDVIIKGKGCN